MPGTLLIRLKGLGDIVHLLPSLRMLRETRPDEPLGLLCQRPFGEIIPEDLGLKVFQIPAHATFAETLQLVRKLRRERFDRLFDLFGNPRTALISLLSGVPFRAGFAYRIRRHAYHATFVPRDSNCHLAELYGQFLANFGCGGKLGSPRLSPPSAAVAKAGRFLDESAAARPLFGVNPHATYPSKAWPMDHFRDLVERWYAATRIPALIFWGPGEEEATRRLVARLGPEKAFTHPPLSIPEFAALLGRLDLFLTGDTGPMNIAWALDIPVVALFGPTTRRAVAPRGDKHLVIFNRDLDCLECHLEVCPDGRCMRDLSPELVFNLMRDKYPATFALGRTSP